MSRVHLAGRPDVYHGGPVSRPFQKCALCGLLLPLQQQEMAWPRDTLVTVGIGWVIPGGDVTVPLCWDEEDDAKAAA